ncbi:hypothetical protein MOKP125_09440 [Mycobacterium avium subsp. hominissuis]
MITRWKAITMGVATIAVTVAGAGLSGRAASQASAPRPRPIATMPPAGLDRVNPARIGNKVNTTP